MVMIYNPIPLEMEINTDDTITLLLSEPLSEVGDWRYELLAPQICWCLSKKAKCKIDIKIWNMNHSGAQAGLQRSFSSFNMLC